ncbi:hypothetical protein DENIS_3128 [Desulfonema ishimotonii]|uniref:Uncharacterized protein n=1 Tax=Desulfonema ishimotonii TaxID=45657 RepID=A0A401FYX8_9BACT|nr:hypothetical protein [Desulfonema ishimotonii]GBC62165.1 hypothetical protein DENIS_3128 [Desulfonema ishimotonii]
MQHRDFYSKSHLIVSAVRILEYRNAEPPAINAVCDMLSFSPEQGHLICNRLHDMGVIEKVKGPFGTRLFVRDHLKLEEIPEGEAGTGLQEEIEKFQNDRKNFRQKIEDFQARKEQEQKDLFAQIEEKLKKGTAR